MSDQRTHKKLKVVTPAGLVSIIAAIGVAGCASQTTNTPLRIEETVAQSLQRYTKEYVLAPGDSIEVVVYRIPELTREVLIRRDGYISLPIVDDVLAAGRTIRDLDDELTRLYSSRVVDPEVTIIIKNAPEPVVYVVGEVGAPHPVPLREARTAAQAIAMAGSVLDSADLSQVSVIRLDDDGYLRAHTIEAQQRAQPALYMALQNVALQADDLIFVPESDRSIAVQAIRDFITTPMGAFNQMLTPYYQVRIIQEIEANN